MLLLICTEILQNIKALPRILGDLENMPLREVKSVFSKRENKGKGVQTDFTLYSKNACR